MKRFIRNKSQIRVHPHDWSLVAQIMTGAAKIYHKPTGIIYSRKNAPLEHVKHFHEEYTLTVG